MSDQFLSVVEVVKVLPPEIQDEVRDFIEFLMGKRAHKSGHVLRQDWGGAIKDYREQYTALELQEQANAWRED
jgi:hypothetical protein